MRSEKSVSSDVSICFDTGFGPENNPMQKGECSVSAVMKWAFRKPPQNHLERHLHIPDCNKIPHSPQLDARR
jgi:hypothetical protein